MVFRRFYKRRRYNRRKRTGNLYREVKQLKRITKPEYKVREYIFSGIPVDTTFDRTDITAIPVGTDNDERIGRRITVKKVEIEGHIVIDSTVRQSLVRVFFLCDKEATTFNYGDVFGKDGVSNVYSFPNLENSTRFKHLKYRTFTLSQNNPHVHFKFSVKCNSLLQFNDTGGSTAIANNWQVGFLGNDPPLTYANLNAVARVTYIDS